MTPCAAVAIGDSSTVQWETEMRDRALLGERLAAGSSTPLPR
jgi:hypothetical protein